MKVAVVGGGAAGMMASVLAARRGVQVTVYEQNEKLGKKLYITGKGRCNLTNACEMEELFASVKSNPKFLYSAFYGFTNQDAMEFFEKEGLQVGRGNKYCRKTLLNSSKTVPKFRYGEYLLKKVP